MRIKKKCTVAVAASVNTTTAAWAYKPPLSPEPLIPEEFCFLGYKEI
jgi:hypothetical protein